MNKFKKIIQHNPLFYACFFPMLVDGIVTLLGQDVSYWENYRSVNEGSPAYFALAISPWLFIIGSITWFFGLYWLFKRLKEPINIILSLAFIAGNSWGSGGWLWKIFKERSLYTPENRLSILISWSLFCIYFLIIGIFATVSFIIYFRNKKH